MHKTRGADVLAQALSRAGVNRIFTVSGNHVMPVFDATLDAGLELIHTRHEAAAVHMADAWGRLTGEAGIALVTGGPGHANALSALFSAQLAESPMVLLSGHAPQDQLGRGAFQEMRQSDIATLVTKASWTASRAAALGSEIARAIHIARSGRRGPVHLSLPTDVLETEAGSRDAPDAASFLPSTMPLLVADAQAIVARLASASRPLILAGPMGRTRAGRGLARTLEDTAGIPVVGMESPRGIGDSSLGAFAAMLGQADCILLLGKRTDFTLRFASSPTLASTCEFMQVDAETIEFERTRRAVGNRLVATAVADSFSALGSLALAAATRRHAHAGWLQEVRSAIRYRPAAWDRATSGVPGRLHPVQVCRPLQALLDRHPDSVLVSDGGEFGQWAQACLTAPHRLINGPAGAIGAALPMALAARLAQPDAPVLAMTGDGSFGFHIAELDTGVRYRLPVVAVVGNDARWNAEYQIQYHAYGPDRLVGCELLPTRYDRVTEAFGGYGEYVDQAEALAPAALRAHASGLPSCLNVALDGMPAPVIKSSS